MTTETTTKKRVAVIGLGYIGLPTAVMMAKGGSQVIGVDVVKTKVDAVNAGQLPFVEPGLGEVLAQVVADGILTAQQTPPAADAYIVAVPTPFVGASHEPDLSYIIDAANKIAPQLVGNELVVLESTSPPGTTHKMAEVILNARPDLSLDGSNDRPIVHFAHCPERVLPGKIMEEMSANDRVIGGLTPKASELARELYATFVNGELVITDAVTAEMSKLAENSFRDVNIAYANELSILADKFGVDVWELISIANRHPRVNILNPGPGVGGHCIAVDPWFLVDAAPDYAQLIHTARNVNDSKPQYVIDKVIKAIADHPSPTIACLGLAFKADIDDLRESPAVEIVADLHDQIPHAKLDIVEPNTTELPKALAGLDRVTQLPLDQALADSDVVLLLVDHKEFKDLDRGQLDDKKVIDTRGIWRDEAIEV